MKGDFSRDTFEPTKHYSRVLMQQGRVQLDADWNEQSSILLEFMRGFMIDLIGPHGGPNSNAGFAITLDANALMIGAGRYYIHGLLVENQQSLALDKQPYHVLNEVEKKLLQPPNQDVLIYLDAWEHHVTALEDANIAEVALGGVDTASRAQVVWQIRLETPPQNLLSGDGTDVSDKNWEDWRNKHEGIRPQMRARTKPGSNSTDPCAISPESHYRGLENQLYRVEIHQGSSNPSKPLEGVTFKFSRENGAVLAAWLDGNGQRLEVSNTRDFYVGNWVEVFSFENEMEHSPGKLTQIERLDSDAIIVHDAMMLEDFKTMPRIRRWDQIERADQKLVNGAIKLEEGSEENDWISLEYGIEVQFSSSQPAVPKRYRTGDYWLIPARVLTGDIQWTTDHGGWLDPHGITHHYAPLSLQMPDSRKSLRRLFNRIPSLG